MQNVEGPFEHVSPALVRLAAVEAQRVLRSVRPLDLSQPLRRSLRIRDLSKLRTEAQARICHPLQVLNIELGDLSYGRWAELSEGDYQITADTALSTLFQTTSGSAALKDRQIEPLIGTLDPSSAHELVRVLEALPGVSEAFFYFWEGGGRLGDGEPHVYHGPIAAMESLYPYGEGWLEMPSLLWADDRRWFVASYTDATSTYVGGPNQLIRALIHDSSLEVQQADPDTLVDEWPSAGGSA